MSKTQKGLPPSKRKIAKHANQYTATPQQKLFITLYLDPKSPTFGNAYQSAIQSGYKEKYANQIASPAIANKWLQEFTNKSDISISHIKEVLADIIRGNVDSRSKTDTQLKAIELLSKLDGHLVERKQIAQVVKVELGEVNKPINQ